MKMKKIIIIILILLVAISFAIRLYGQKKFAEGFRAGQFSERLGKMPWLAPDRDARPGSRIPGILEPREI